MMIQASKIVSHTHHPVDTITLDETGRHRRRLKMISDGGIEFLLNLAEARMLRGGEGIELEDGRVIEVIAAAERLYTVKAKDADHLLRLAWQLGNRHLPTQIMGDHLRIRQDRVIRDMLEGLGAEISEIVEPFDPEGGAYGGRNQHHHGHDHD